MQVFAVGTNLPTPVASTKVILGGIVNPRTGSSSAHVVNISIWAKLIIPLLPSRIRKKEIIYYSKHISKLLYCIINDHNLYSSNIGLFHLISVLPPVEDPWNSSGVKGFELQIFQG
jgi:hypothetical protein